MSSIDEPRERLRRSRNEIVALAAKLRRDGARANSAFPRSAIMRAATGPTGRKVLGGAALMLALMRPGLLRTAGRMLPVAMPLLRSALNRYLVRRFIG
jgi:hypothetical protein